MLYVNGIPHTTWADYSIDKQITKMKKLLKLVDIRNEHM